MLKDLEQEKSKYSKTPRKSLNGSMIDDKENKFSHSFSLKDIENHQVSNTDHYKDHTLFESQRSYSMALVNDRQISIEKLKELVHVDKASSSFKSDKPPTYKQQSSLFLHNNNNKLKLREKLKKLKLTKAELINMVKEIELEKVKISELKSSTFNDIRKVLCPTYF